MANEVISKRTFYRGFLLAVAKNAGKEFLADGADFHRAFDEAVRVRNELSDVPVIEGERWLRIDPVFGVMKAADEMLLFGERERLLTLGNPELQKASFKISREEAAVELEDVGNVELFDKMAGRFLERLKR
jgi:hypothetical protein